MKFLMACMIVSFRVVEVHRVSACCFDSGANVVILYLMQQG
jgi:hypothetical protein